MTSFYSPFFRGKPHGRESAKSQFASNVCSLVDSFCRGNVSEFCRSVGFSRSTVDRWMGSRQCPSLTSLMLVASCFRIPLINLVFADVRGGSHSGLRLITPDIASMARRKLQKRNVALLKETLESSVAARELAPPSLRSLCARTGVDQSYAMRKFPRLASEIVSRYKLNQNLQKQKRLNFVKMQVESVVRRLDAQGAYPSQDRVRKLLPSKCDLREPFARAQRLRLIRELGWKNGTRTFQGASLVTVADAIKPLANDAPANGVESPS